MILLTLLTFLLLVFAAASSYFFYVAQIRSEKAFILPPVSNHLPLTVTMCDVVRDKDIIA